MYTSSTEIRVRYAETDQMGFVYYGNYATYFEIGRVEALRSLGLSYRVMEEQGCLLPVVDFHIKYHAPATYDDLIRVETTIDLLPTSKIHFVYKCFRDDKLLTSAETTLVFMNSDTKRPMRCPQPLLDKLQSFFM